MGENADFDWDDSKDELLLRTRGFHIWEVAAALFEGIYYEHFHPEYPGQTRATGFCGGSLLTLAFIEEEPDYRPFLITYWPASREERNNFNKEVGR